MNRDPSGAFRHAAARNGARLGRQAMGSLISVALALLLGAAAILLAGKNPLTAYALLLQGAFGSVYSWSEVLLRTTPILIAGIGLSVSFRSNLTSIGAEGQIIIGGIFTAAAGLLLPTVIPAFLRVVLCVAAGFAGGALYGLIPGFLKARLGTSEIIVTIMLNYVAISLMSFLLDGPMREPGSFYPQSAELSQDLWFPALIPGMRLHIGLLIALLLVAGYYFLMFRLPLGFKIRTVGLNRSAAEYAGIRVERSIIIAMLISGGLAGIAGSGEILGIHHRLFNDFAAGFGYDALAVALLGRLHPLGVLVSALFFAALKVGSGAMQRAAQVPTTIVYVIQGLLILFIFTDKLILEWFTKAAKRLKQRGASDVCADGKEE
ncbi:MAG: ABC transporter permease [Bacillota bacterium]